MFDYNKFFEEHPVDIHNQVERHEKIASLCKGKVIDIGCGTGSLSEYYEGDYTGYDIADSAIERARKHRRKTAKFFAGDFTRIINFDFEPYDTIVMAEFLEHIRDDHNIFESIEKHAHHATRIIISVPNYDRVPDESHVRTFTIAGLRERFEKIGDVKFYNWHGEKDRIIMTIDFKIFTDPYLTLGIIAKNEEAGIERALLSCIEAAEKMVVLVDNNTTDKTFEIARRYTDQVSFYNWQNNFSAARNELLESVITPWTLMLDGHEYLKEFGHIQDLFATPQDAYMCQINLDNGSIVRFPRLHFSNLRYKDEVHNRLEPNNLGNADQILIVHDRTYGQSAESTSERENQRHQMITEIMGRQLRKNKKNIRASMHLGLHYHARKEFKKAIFYYNKYLRYSKFAGERWYIRFNIAYCNMLLNRNYRAEYQTKLMELESPGRWETKFIRALTQMNQKLYFKAIENFNDSLCVQKQESEYKPLPRDHSTTWNNIGECYFKLGRYYEAGESFKRAAQHTKDKKFSELVERRSSLMFEMYKKENEKI